MQHDSEYIPALRYRWLTSLYDPIIAITTREKKFKKHLIDLADIKTNDAVLDVGCGTGTLAIGIKKTASGANVIGIDGDPEILELARRKAQKEKVEIVFDQGLSFDLPYQNSQFDRCLSSLFFHHLTLDNKLRTFREIHRVLKIGGQCHIADWGKPTNLFMRLLYYQIQVLDGFKTTRDNVEGQLPALMQSSGFSNILIKEELATIFGTMTLYSAKKL
ncbi:MAG: class I SAM-dependent methyltransferase [Gammaproteobacteria bacterium]|nr:class I SAM-dependent methyltransferase [Gammaproteobacteria bacterium]